MEGDEHVPTVLVVDDTLFMRVAISNMFTEWGYEVVGKAVNGKEAVAMYRELQPDLVTMDVTMPVMTGIAAVKKNHPRISRCENHYGNCTRSAKINRRSD